jgi:hypothetical protein
MPAGVPASMTVTPVTPITTGSATWAKLVRPRSLGPRRRAARSQQVRNRPGQTRAGRTPVGPTQVGPTQVGRIAASSRSHGVRSQGSPSQGSRSQGSPSQGSRRRDPGTPGRLKGDRYRANEVGRNRLAPARTPSQASRGGRRLRTSRRRQTRLKSPAAGTGFGGRTVIAGSRRPRQALPSRLAAAPSAACRVPAAVRSSANVLSKAGRLLLPPLPPTLPRPRPAARCPPA